MRIYPENERQVSLRKAVQRILMSYHMELPAVLITPIKRIRAVIKYSMYRNNEI